MCWSRLIYLTPIFKQSGHLSKEGVRSYERMTDVQMKHVSDVLSDISASSKENTDYPKMSKPGSTSTVDTQEWDQLDATDSPYSRKFSRDPIFA